jgi:hypothetical protein
MKAGETFKLEYRWWDKGRPITLKSTGLGKALQLYEKNQADPVLALEALAAVDAARKKAIAMCANPRFAETKAALEKTAALDLAVKTHEKRVLQVPVGAMMAATNDAENYVGHMERLFKDYENATDNPLTLNKLRREVGIRATNLRDALIRAKDAREPLIEHQTALKQYQSLWTKIIAASRKYDNVADQAKPILIKARNFAGGN